MNRDGYRNKKLMLFSVVFIVCFLVSCSGKATQAGPPQPRTAHRPRNGPMDHEGPRGPARSTQASPAQHSPDQPRDGPMDHGGPRKTSLAQERVLKLLTTTFMFKMSFALLGILGESDGFHKFRLHVFVRCIFIRIGSVGFLGCSNYLCSCL